MKKVLVISNYFSLTKNVYGIIGALRIKKFCKYLPELGWFPIVLTRNILNNRLEIENSQNMRIVYIQYKKEKLFQNVDQTLMGKNGYKSKWAQSKLRNLLVFLTKEIFYYPDEFRSWLTYAVNVGVELVKEEKIDLIFSSALPPTVHLITSQIQKRTNLPWVAEYRDLWSENYYLKHFFIRSWFERKLEVKTLQNAKLLITVSEPLAEKLRQMHKKPVEVITNGFDDEDYKLEVPLTPYFSITYTGQIYEGKQDPTLLFIAVKKLIEDRKTDEKFFKIRFYGPEKDIPKIEFLAEKYNLQKVVKHYGPMPLNESIIRQKESTILLLLNWNSPEEKGVYTGKIFEYLGAGRPILAIPKIDGGVVDELLKKTNCGVSVSDLDEIINILLYWYKKFTEEKKLTIDPNYEEIKKFTRKELTKKLAYLFDRIIFNHSIGNTV